MVSPISYPVWDHADTGRMYHLISASSIDEMKNGNFLTIRNIMQLLSIRLIDAEDVYLLPLVDVPVGLSNGSIGFEAAINATTDIGTIDSCWSRYQWFVDNSFDNNHVWYGIEPEGLITTIDIWFRWIVSPAPLAACPWYPNDSFEFFHSSHGSELRILMNHWRLSNQSRTYRWIESKARIRK